MNMKKALRGTVVKSRTICPTEKGKRSIFVELRKDGDFYTVYVDGELYKKSANELFAIHVFNAI